MHRRRAVLIVPPDSAMAPVQAIRLRFDPLADTVPAHLTLVFPFESDISDERLRHHIESAIEGVPRFGLRLTGFSCAHDHYLFLNVGLGSDQIRDLHRRIYAGPLADFLAPTPYTPHVTAGRFPTAEECATALDKLGRSSLTVEPIATGVAVYDLGTTPYSVRFEVRWG